MGYNFRDYLEMKRQDEVNLFQWDKSDVQTTIKTFTREFYKAGEMFVCNLADFLWRVKFETYKSNKGYVSFSIEAPDERNAKTWLEFYKDVFSLKINANLFHPKNDYYITVEKAVEILEYMISQDKKVLAANEVFNEIKYSYIEDALNKRQQLLTFLQDKIVENSNRVVVEKVKFEGIVEGVVKSKGLETKCVFFSKTDYKACVDLHHLLTHLGFDEVATDKPLVWLLMNKYKLSAQNNINYYVDKLLDVVYVDIDLAIDICDIVYNTYDDETNRRRISHMKKFLKTQYSTKNPKRILENEEHIEKLKNDLTRALMKV